jgi:hypothetical protein
MRNQSQGRGLDGYFAFLKRSSRAVPRSVVSVTVFGAISN